MKPAFVPTGFKLRPSTTKEGHTKTTLPRFGPLLPVVQQKKRVRCARQAGGIYNATMYTLRSGTEATAEMDVKRSRFIGRLAPLGGSDPEGRAREIIDEEKTTYPDARHHCSAYVIEGAGATPLTHSSDDGEPAGTAGAPMLEALLGAELANVVAVATRYFGGTLLGTGGLVRAYAGITRKTVEAAHLVQLVELPLFRATIDLTQAGRVEAEIRQRGWNVVEADWGAHLKLAFTTGPGEEGEVEPLLAALTRTNPDVRQTGSLRQEVSVNR